MDSKILQILAKHNLTASMEFVEAMREAYQAGAEESEPTEQQKSISPAEKSALKALGIDTDKKFTIRNSTFTITGYSPSRWKFPISATTQNGTRYKFTLEQVRNNQK